MTRQILAEAAGHGDHLTAEKVIRFALRWAEHGGGPTEEISTTFAVMPSDYFTACSSSSSTLRPRRSIPRSPNG